MIAQSSATIFLAENRDHCETDGFRTYTTFAHAIDEQNKKHAFGLLSYFAETTLAGGRSRVEHAAENLTLVLIPIAGWLTYTDCHGNNATIAAGNILVKQLSKTNSFNISNTQPNGLVSYLELRFDITRVSKITPPQIVPFEDGAWQNALFTLLSTPVSNPDFLRIAIGKFNGRAEEVYTLNHAQNGVLFFVITGAFEIQHRLVQACDSLALWNLSEVEIEALSNEAVLLAIEMRWKGNETLTPF